MEVVSCNEGSHIVINVNYEFIIFLILLTRYRSKDKIGDLSLLIQNTLRQDFYDPNPIIRKLALQTICSCASRPETMVEFLELGLKDASSCVRRSAALRCITLYNQDPELILSYAFSPRLYRKLGDKDSLVVSNSLVALEEILKDEGGVVINHNITCHLLSHLQNFTDWGLINVLSLLRKYKPEDETEMFDILNILDPFLQNKNCSIVIKTVELFLFFLSDYPHLKEDVFKRVAPQLASFLNNSTSPEKVYLLLGFIQENVTKYPTSFQSLYKSMFCRFDEHVHIKLKKIDILTKLATEESINDIQDEISMHCTSPVDAVSKAAISAIGILAKNHPCVFELCVAKLIQLLTLEQESITSHVLFIFQGLDLQKLEKVENFVVHLQTCHNSLKSEGGKCAFLWLLGELGSSVPESPYILEHFISECTNSHNVLFKNAILTTALKLFFKRPAECQMILGRIFEICHYDVNIGIRNQVHFYYKLLKYNIEVAQQIVSNVTDDDIERFRKDDKVLVNV